MNAVAQFDWDALLRLKPLLFDFVAKKSKGESIDLRDTVAQVAEAFGIEDLEGFAVEKLHSALNTGFGFAFDDDSAEDLASIFARDCTPIMQLITQYAQGDITAPKLLGNLEKMRKNNVDNIQVLLQNSLNIPDETADAIADKLGPYTVSVYCFLATYKIYRKAADDADRAKEQRIEAERLASEMIGKLKTERAEMEDCVNSYLLDRIIPFGAGLTAMDQAVIENDDDGFIQANAELWQVFGRQSQYSNAEEFDDLMLSDEAFKL